MLIASIDLALESMLRSRLPLPETVGDVSFDPPDRSWGARLSRVTINLFLFDIARSAQPPLPAASRLGDDDVLERRGPLPMVQLSYLVTAWAGGVRDEHQLLGDVLTCLLTTPVLPAELLPEPLAGTVQLSLADREGRKPGDLWSSMEGRLRPAIELNVTCAVEAWPWVAAPTAVTSITGYVPPGHAEALLPQKPEPGPTVTRRRTAQGVVSEVARSPTGSR